MMKTATKTILTSIWVIVMCFILITGATYALFTSESETSIAVTAGDVEVFATASINGAWSAKWDDTNGAYVPDDELEIVTSDDGGKTYHFTNGGSAYMQDGQVILNNITPGDGVQIKVNITNESTVSIKYMVAVAANTGVDFFNTLTTTITYDEEMKKPYESTWKTIEAGSTDTIVPVYVNIEFPWANSNLSLAQTCTIIVTVVAVQNTMHTVDGVTPD